YFWPVCRTLLEWRYPVIRVEIDDREVFNDRGLAFVGNANRYAFGLNILKDALSDDGLLDVCIYKCSRRADLLAHSLATASRRHIGRPGVTYCRAAAIRVTCGFPIPVEIDGELFGTTPVEYSIVPRAARFNGILHRRGAE